MVKPYPHQREAVSKIKNGSILIGGTGSGKSITSLFYYYEKIIGGSTEPPAKPKTRVDLYIMTTARKRDDGDWQMEAARFGISDKGQLGIRLKVDSWNNIKKYVDIKNAFFIFDEQRSVGSGSWSSSMIKIARKNQWVMLSATPGDRWIDYASVFIANGFYKNRTQFKELHVRYAPYVKYPRIVGYLNTSLLESYRSSIQVEMPFERHTIPHTLLLNVEYDKEAVDKVLSLEWNPFTDSPIKHLPEEMSVLRRLIFSHPSRLDRLIKIQETVKKLIVFYSYNFELDILKSGFKKITEVAEYNGKKHEDVPRSDNWIYLVQYTSGSEAWECFTTNHMAFYSLNYSYRVMTQARGRIDRITTPYRDLYYYYLVSTSALDVALHKAIETKKVFNEKNFLKTIRPRDSQRV